MVSLFSFAISMIALVLAIRNFIAFIKLRKAFAKEMVKRKDEINAILSQRNMNYSVRTDEEIEEFIENFLKS